MGSGGLEWDQGDWDSVREIGNGIRRTGMWCQGDWDGVRGTGMGSGGLGCSWRMGLYSGAVQLTWVLMFRVKNRLRYTIIHSYQYVHRKLH